jgi:hypothetical protein
MAEVPPLPVRWLAAFERGAGHMMMMDAREQLEARRSRSAADIKERDRTVRLAAKADVRAAKARRRDERERDKRRVVTTRKRRKLTKMLRARLGLG